MCGVTGKTGTTHGHADHGISGRQKLNQKTVVKIKYKQRGRRTDD
jgi:hypothetical protein